MGCNVSPPSQSTHPASLSSYFSFLILHTLSASVFTQCERKFMLRQHNLYIRSLGGVKGNWLRANGVITFFQACNYRSITSTYLLLSKEVLFSKEIRNCQRRIVVVSWLHAYLFNTNRYYVMEECIASLPPFTLSSSFGLFCLLCLWNIESMVLPLPYQCVLWTSQMKQMLFGCRKPVDSLLHHRTLSCYECVLGKRVSQPWLFPCTLA